MVYLVVRDGNAFPDPTPIKPRTGLGTWNLAHIFTGENYAVEAAESWHEDYPGEHIDVVTGTSREDIDTRLGVHDIRADVVWCSHVEGEGRSIDRGHYDKPEGSTMGLPHEGWKLPQPINVDREQVVARIQEQLAEEAAEREKVEAKERQARLGVDQFVTDHQDEIVEYLGRTFGGSWRQIEERLADMFKDDAFKPQKMKKGRKETDLEKMARVLAMSADKTIEVQPTSPIYDLL